MDFDDVMARHAFGVLPVEELPKIAVHALQVGYDSPSLRQLAGTPERDSEECHKLFEETIRELKLPTPSVAEAGLIIARKIAQDVLSGTLAPYEGAKQIWDKVYTRLPELEQLRPFVGLASEYEDDAQHRDAYSRDIIEHCENLTRK